MQATFETTPARIARYERLGAYFDRDRDNLEYQRRKEAARKRDDLPRVRERRQWDRANRERDAIKARGLELWTRRERLYGARAIIIKMRLIEENRIRPAGKTPGSQARFRKQVDEAWGADKEAQALMDRYDGGNRRMRAIEERRQAADLQLHIQFHTNWGTMRADRHALRRAMEGQ